MICSRVNPICINSVTISSLCSMPCTIGLFGSACSYYYWASGYYGVYSGTGYGVGTGVVCGEGFGAGVFWTGVGVVG